VVAEAAAYSLYNDALKIIQTNKSGLFQSLEYFIDVYIAALSLLEAAKRRCQEALHSVTRNAALHHLKANIEYQLALATNWQIIQDSMKTFSTALNLAPNHPQILYDFANLLATGSDLTK
jgi:tetratricopeptide (TPR) repeat protein